MNCYLMVPVMLPTVLALLGAACACTLAVPIQTSANSMKTIFVNEPVSVSAFNIKTFGQAKMSNEQLANIITKIVSRYDVILIQEIRDISGASFHKLWQMVNASDPSRPYGMVISERLGRSSYKEQYMYMYRLDRLELLGVHQYDDGLDDYSDPFEREPYSALFRTKSATPAEFVLVGVHIKPEDAVAEIGHMYNVYLDILGHWPGVKNVLVMGDLNADCSYASENDLRPLTIYSDPRFDWLLGWEADTTVSTNTDCAYDRFIAAGTELRSAIVPGSSAVYRYEKDFVLDYNTTMAVSDHYPIEVDLDF